MATTESTAVNLNKTTLAEALAERNGFAVPVARATVEDIFEIIAVTVAAGGSVQITNFGRVERVDRKAAQRRNPHTGESISVEAGKRVKWTISPRLTAYANSANPALCTIRKNPKSAPTK